MIRLSELRLPLAALPLDPEQHPDTALHALAAQTLGLAPEAIATLRVHKRSFDARKAELLAVYIVDVALADAAQGGVGVLLGIERQGGQGQAQFGQANHGLGLSSKRGRHGSTMAPINLNQIGL